jgi:hypothetical protein
MQSKPLLAFVVTSVCPLSAQSRQSDEVVGGGREAEGPSDPFDGAESRLSLPGGGFCPAEYFLDTLAYTLADRVTGMSGGASVDLEMPRAPIHFSWTVGAESMPAIVDVTVNFLVLSDFFSRVISMNSLTEKWRRGHDAMYLRHRGDQLACIALQKSEDGRWIRTGVGKSNRQRRRQAVTMFDAGIRTCVCHQCTVHENLC